MAHLHQLFPALFGDRLPVAEPFDLWPKSAYPATLDIYDQGPDAPPLSDSQRDVLRHTRSGAIAPVYNGDQLTIDGLYPFLQAWKDYRLHYGQKDLITSFSEQIIITLALKFWPDLSGDPLTLFRRNFIGPENEPVLFRMLHEFFHSFDTASARTSLERCARLYAQSYPFRQPSRAIQWLLGYYDKFIFRLRCCGETVLPSQDVIVEIFFTGYPAFLSRAVQANSSRLANIADARLATFQYLNSSSAIAEVGPLSRAPCR